MREQDRFPAEADVWLPLTQLGADDLASRGARRVWVVGRLRPGVSEKQAFNELHSIARRLEEATPDERILALVEVDDAGARLELASAGQASVTWLCRDAGEVGLPEAVARLTLPDGSGFVWAAGEYASIRQVRQTLIETHGLDRHRIKASSYWKQGEIASHETLSD
jgi:hypothetical protein